MQKFVLKCAISLMLVFAPNISKAAQSYIFNFTTLNDEVGGTFGSTISGATIQVTASPGFITAISGGTFTGDGWTNAAITWATIPANTFTFNASATGAQSFFSSSGAFPTLSFTVSGQSYGFATNKTGVYQVTGYTSLGDSTAGGNANVQLLAAPEINGNALGKGVLLLVCLYLLGALRNGDSTSRSADPSGLSPEQTWL